MNHICLGKSKIIVSKICLGTMTFGEQVDEKLSNHILNYAFDSGINFIDTAEMYPIPAKKNTYGRTEEIIGGWLKKTTNSRNEIIIASKVSGPSRGMDWIRGGASELTSNDIIASCEASLKRLNTDYIDLYQIHWPVRHAAIFGNLYFDSSKSKVEDIDLIENQLFALDKLVKEGKVRAIGVSNETPYGIYEFVRISEKLGYQKIITIQNPYCLIGRMAENGLDEMLFNLGITFLGYSPLAFGLLTGKYDQGISVGGASLSGGPRLELYESVRNQRWGKKQSLEVAIKYNKLAREFGLKPSQMALAFCYGKKLLGSTIIGVTSLNQLKENIDAISINLSPELLSKIDEVRYIYRDPV